MQILILILLIIIGVLLIAAEILVLPGITVAAIGAAGSFIAAVMVAFYFYSLESALWVLLLSVLLSVATIVLCLRRKSLKKLSLETNIDSVAQQSADTMTVIGAHGVAITRLAPMGVALIDGSTIEAKSIEGYIPEKSKIEVVRFENSVVVVKLRDK